MKRFFVILAALTLIAGAANAQVFAESEIGLYTVAAPTGSETSYMGAPGPTTVYAVVTNPMNYHTGAPDSDVVSAISVLGGFEFKVVWPANVFNTGVTYPAGTTNFLSPPNFLAGCNIPVVNGAAVCVTLGMYYLGGPGMVYLSPVDNVPSIPGFLAITDFNDDFRLNKAYPVSGSFAAPVFAFGGEVVDAQDASWGEVKSLFR